MMKDNNHELIRKLDQFIRKYYKNRLIRGITWSFALTGFLFLLTVIPEFFFYFDQSIRTGIFFTYSALLVFVLVRLILIPCFQLLRIGKLISYEQAAGIIGTHFSEIKDKLLNTLQLIEQGETSVEHGDLIQASIGQKTKALKVFQFSRAVDFRKNLKYVRLAAIPLAIILIIFIFSPRTISEPTQRIIRFNETFIQPLPYSVVVLNKHLVALQQEDFELLVKVSGEEVPAEVYLKTGDISYKMQRQKGFVFSYLFKSLQSNVNFKVIAGELETKLLTLVVLPKPIILNFDLSVKYPEYTGKKDEVVENQGDLVVPEGTVIVWNFYTRDVGDILMKFSPEMATGKVKSGNRFSFSGTARVNTTYSIKPVNSSVVEADSLVYRVMVVNDGFPSIFVTESADSVLATNLFFRGTIKDDYGFSKMTFNYCIYEKGDTAGARFTVENIPIDGKVNNQVFYYDVDLVKLLPEPGKEIMYFFEVSDNDRIHGPKSARSEMRTIVTPTLDEIAEKTDENAEFMNDELEKSIADAKAIKKTMEDLNKQIVDQSSISWQEKKKIDELIKAHEAIQERIEAIKKKSSENQNNEDKYLETSERIMEKQKALDEMMDQLFPEELKKLVEELKALLNKVDKEKLGNLLEKMKMTNKELENQLDRNLALMKQIEFDRKLEATVNELRKTAEELEKLSEKTEKPESDQEKLLKEQADLKQKADSLNDKVDKLVEDSKKLEDPVDLGNTEKLQDSIRKNMTEGKKNLEGKNKKKAAESQRKASKEMKQLADQMESAGEESEEGQMEEDAQNIRMILENLVRLSFDQESLIKQTKNIVRTDPKYLPLVLRQKEFRDKMQVVEDSLKAIAKRQLMIKPIVTKELNAISQNIDLALEAFESRNISAVVTRQQFAMTALNNLALLLNESLQKMNEQISSCKKSKSGNKSCSNPSAGKSGKKSAKDMKDIQGKIGEQLKKLKEGLEGSKKPGSAGKSEQSAMNREIAKLAAQQEALRNEMQKYQDDLGAKGIKDQSGLKEASRDMEQIEKDLVNKRISQETMLRQQKILTRLLESEKAEQIREREEKRESVEAKNHKISNLGVSFEYNSKKRNSQDQLQRMLPELNSYYKSKVNAYIVKIEP